MEWYTTSIKYLFTSTAALAGSAGSLFVNRSKFAMVTYHPPPDGSTDPDSAAPLRLVHPRHRGTKALPYVEVRLKPRDQALFVPTWWMLMTADEGPWLRVQLFDDPLTAALRMVPS